MKKFLFVALLGALVACNDTTTTTTSEDSARMADSISRANQNSMMGTDTTGGGTMMGTDTTGTGGSMMGTDTTGTGGSTMSTDTTQK